ncbi:Transglycosylase, Slt family [Methylophaga frappieri]|uniref:Membrane-bound lytic murein transglycosylase F n=1 Tax=Methylophaga frappieri (strain ATCC BAA-2434 / DSM 25690 / JAM7) TaxID=754477 RepID=I1YIL9_METFJ|nr:membrane-bound lytic murein transglycosylase MltF [Methylophaga frappieri]AFJ02762.1 Transglycosylase, Slt family [Methylophaga frappieri]
MRQIIRLLTLICLGIATACNDDRTHLDRILERGELRVATRTGLTNYYEKTPGEFSGFEYELAQHFADTLGVDLNMIVPANLSEMLTMLDDGRADIAAAGLTMTPERQQKMRFGPVYHEVTQQLIYRNGAKRPRNIANLGNGQLEIIANSSHEEHLIALQKEIPDLSWIPNHDADSQELLGLIELELIDYTITDSIEFAAIQGSYPELRVAFDVSDPQPLAWGLAKGPDVSLYREVMRYFEQIEEKGFLDKLIERYYGHIRRFDYVDTRAIHRRILTHLPDYESWFMEASSVNNFDWRLLAAIAYQESHWNPTAVSSTGVKGLMMLTRATAEEMGVTDREDPYQSIMAGSAYLDEMRKRLPERIQEPDRTWLALAAYNIGLGHLEDARILTQKNGGNPDRWSDIRENLPLLAQKKWFEQTRYGYANGGEPVRYVANIRRYYDILLQHENINPIPPPVITPPEGPSQALPAAL